MAKQKTLENSVKAGINRYLREIGGKWFHYSAMGGAPGVSDKLGFINGHQVYIEAKRPDRKTHKDGGLSKAQLLFEEAVRTHGVSCPYGTNRHVHYIRAYHWFDVRDYLIKKNIIGE